MFLILYSLSVTSHAGMVFGKGWLGAKIISGRHYQILIVHLPIVPSTAWYVADIPVKNLWHLLDIIGENLHGLW